MTHVLPVPITDDVIMSERKTFVACRHEHSMGRRYVECLPSTSNSARTGNIFSDSSSNFNGINVLVKKEQILLGVLFVSKLTFVSNLKRVKLKCLKSTNILKIFSHKYWGADRKHLLRTGAYKAPIRSRLD